MKRELYKSERFSPEEEEIGEMILEYYITQSEHPFKTGNINYVCYGVEVRKICPDKDACSEIESAEEIFFSKEKAEEFLNLLAKEKVTPCSLCEIVSDKLKEALI